MGWGDVGASVVAGSRTSIPHPRTMRTPSIRTEAPALRCSADSLRSADLPRRTFRSRALLLWTTSCILWWLRQLRWRDPGSVEESSTLQKAESMCRNKGAKKSRCGTDRSSRCWKARSQSWHRPEAKKRIWSGEREECLRRHVDAPRVGVVVAVNAQTDARQVHLHNAHLLLIVPHAAVPLAGLSAGRTTWNTQLTPTCFPHCSWSPSCSSRRCCCTPRSLRTAPNGPEQRSWKKNLPSQPPAPIRSSNSLYYSCILDRIVYCNYHGKDSTLQILPTLNWIQTTHYCEKEKKTYFLVQLSHYAPIPRLLSCIYRKRHTSNTIRFYHFNSRVFDKKHAQPSNTANIRNNTKKQ